MFTGITLGTFAVTRVERKPDLLRYAVALPVALREGLRTGASVAIDGVCQTVVAIEGDDVVFEAIRETLDKTTLDALVRGAAVGVERSYRIGDELGGHEVAGHVTCTGTIEAVRREGDVCNLRVAVPSALMRYILPKGFIAIDGSSLTVGATDARGSFDLHLIPETVRLTNLGTKRAGGRVNVELDARTVAIVDTVERVLAARAAT
ncbi:MAG: riboflavin synthase subunit alpha [Polyangiales bacterium]